MKTTIASIPVIKKSTIQKKTVAGTSCCTPKNNASVCCTPGESKEDNGGACCAQPEDGSACCDK